MSLQLPPGYWPAINKYFDPHGRGDITDILVRLNRWRCPPRGLPPLATDIMKSDVADFQKEILKAVYDGDLAFIENLSKAMAEAIRPDPLDAVRAVLIGFENLFFGDTRLPTMAAVKCQAIKILKEKGRPIPRPNHWSRIFADAGLSDLPHERPGRPPKKLAQK
jgi:hypothetical protein